MVRSMYSGVSGMRTHQTRMDVIGNNIANVNTYGYKSSRATFRDMYYQSLKSASGATANRGGVNPSSVGYGVQLGSIDLQMTQSSMTSTGNPLDVAITGEGFFQVMDADGNIFYTKAGMLDIDSAGNLIDTNGYFVLGTSGDPLGKVPGTGKIQFNIPAVPPSPAEKTETINGNTITIKATNSTNEGNAAFSIVEATLPVGQDCEAILSGGSITIRVNKNSTFASMGAFETAVNNAITTANGGKAHPAGNFKFSIVPASAFPAGGLTGAEITGKNYSYKKGDITGLPNDMFGGFNFVSVGDHFSGNGTVTSVTLTSAAASNPMLPTDSVTITVNTSGGSYTKTILASEMATANNVILGKTGSADAEDHIVMSFPAIGVLEGNTSSTPPAAPAWTTVTPAAGTTAVTASEKSRDLGFSEKAIKLEGGTVGGAQTIKDLTGIYIAGDGTVVASHAHHGVMQIGRIDLANFDNPRGLIQTGNSYYASSVNSGEPSLEVAGTNGTGALQSSALELSNVDLSQEFADMITTQRGFQANSRLITVSDTMLEELINLKR